MNKPHQTTTKPRRQKTEEALTPLSVSISYWVVKTALFCGMMTSVNAADSDDSVDFNRDIRPILSENCSHCHGPDAESRKAKLRMDDQASTRAQRDGLAAITPGDLEKSEAWHRITSVDPDDLMPPPDSKRSLSKKQIDLLKRWIENGAEFEKHWAYEAPKRPEVPKSENPVDLFVQKRLAGTGLSPSAPATREAQIRRLSLDLIGLPPSPEEVSAFASDESPQAFEKLVDRLLASPRFGEHWARPWLDLARYADSNGYQADQLRDSWAYRDWVIDALNANMPFDQFTIEQLAGDLLPNATVSQKVATGFHRTVTCNVEAGVHPEENRTNQVIDRVNTTATVWLGSTMECSQCHDHKYDPFTMRDYYGMLAYFNNTPLEVRNPSGKGVSFDFYGPKMDLPMSSEKKSDHDELTASLTQLQKERKEAELGLEKSRVDWEKQMAASIGKTASWKVLEIADFSGSRGESFESLDDGSILVTGPVPETSTYTITAMTDLTGVRAIKVEILAHESLNGKGPGRTTEGNPNSILSEARLEISVDGGKKSPVKLTGAVADFAQNKWDAANAIDGDPKSGWAIGPEFGKDHWIYFKTGSAVGNEFILTLEQNYGGGRVIGCLRISATTGEPDAETLDADLSKILTTAPEQRTEAEKKKLDTYFAKENPVLKEMDRKIAQIEARLKAVEPDTTLVMVEMDEPRETSIMKRGNYLDTGDKVEAHTPEVLHQAVGDQPKNRLGFAQWLMDPDNPLVARVTVNRWWAEIFGRGIVRTSEDFGTQADPPSHPELLDWLAVEFMESGWDMKHILKTIVMSNTYRQDSKVTSLMLEIDPDNQFLARGPRFRMSAEMIRDNALTVSGLLSTKMQGPPIMPFQPPGMWRQIGRNEPVWVEAIDENRWRRGVYVVWRRAAPYPSFVNFDGPDRSACVVQRPRTNTPLQALTLLNDPVYTEAALALADRILTEMPDASVDSQIEHAFQIVLNRTPASGEMDHVRYLLNERLERLAAEKSLAPETISGASSVYKAKAKDQTALAAWYFISNVLLNLDEVVTKG